MYPWVKPDSTSSPSFPDIFAYGVVRNKLHRKTPSASLLGECGWSNDCVKRGGCTSAATVLYGKTGSL